MARLQIIGFETGDLSESGNVSANVSVQSAITHDSAFAMRVNPTGTASGDAEFHPLNTDGTISGSASFGASDLYVRFYFRFDLAPASGSEEIATLIAGDSETLMLRLRQDGKLELYDTSTAPNLLGTGATVLVAGKWYRIEMHGQSGSGLVDYEVRIRGVTEFSGTHAGASGTQDSLDLGKLTDRNGNSVDFYYDDIAIDDSTWPGSGAVKAVRANGDGDLAQWTIGAGAGSNWQQVDEALPHDGNTTYLLSTLTDGNVDLVSLDASGIVGPINYVAAYGYLRFDTNPQTSGGSVLRMRSGGVDLDTSSNYLAIFGSYILLVLGSASPPDGGSWTSSKLNSLQIGLVNHSTVRQARCTWLGAMVEYAPALSLIAGSGLGAAAIADPVNPSAGAIASLADVAVSAGGGAGSIADASVAAQGGAAALAASNLSAQGGAAHIV